MSLLKKSYFTGVYLWINCRIECSTSFLFLSHIQLQLPPHLQSPVRARFAFEHLQGPRHADLQEHLIGSEQVSFTCGSDVQYGNHSKPSSRIQP